MKIKIVALLFLLLSYSNSLVSQTTSPEPPLVFPRQFVHPGMLQSQADLEYMKAKIKSGDSLWVAAYQRLQEEASMDFEPQAFTHVVRGSYGRQGQGHRELSASAMEAYRQALLWYVTDNRQHAEKAVSIISAWSEKLWDFDDNDAKLIAALTGQHFLNAAEILKYTYDGWEDDEIKALERMMLTVYYPYIRDFFTEANGNWDASMIHTMLCIGVFTDRSDIFQRAAERFYWGPNNGGITKYIYPNGQIQESTRDWPHVQLGLGEFAKAAQVAWTQGMDFYAVADKRLALGFEYTAKYMLGEEVQAYGTISPRGRGEFRDIYESIYHHYTQVKNGKLPYTEKAIQQTRPSSSWYFLISQRAPALSETPVSTNPPLESARQRTGVAENPDRSIKSDDLIVKPGESIQKALDKAAGTGKKVMLEKGIYRLDHSLLIPGETHLEGMGAGTILILGADKAGITIGNKVPEIQHVVIRNLLIEGATSVDPGNDPNQGRRQRGRQSALRREGLVFSADKDGQIKHITLENVTVRNFTKHGVSIRGAENVQIIHCDFSDNGSNVVPGKGLHHNLHLMRVTNVKVTDGRFSNSPWGSGIHLLFGENVVLAGNESARNKLHGIHITETKTGLLENNLLEGNDLHGLFLDNWMEGVHDFDVKSNIFRNNGGKGSSSLEGNQGTIGYNLSVDNKEDIVYGKTTDAFHKKYQHLLALMDFEAGFLTESTQNAGNPLVAAREMLHHYRERTTVKHPVDRQELMRMENPASEREMEMANDALAHIMVGQPAYPPFYVGEDIDWGSRPVSDNEWVWQLNRMTFWDAMAKAYWQTGEEKYARDWVRQMMDWVEKNPRDAAHHYAWRSIETGIRGHRWTNLFQYFLDSPSFTPEALVSFLAAVQEHADFLMTKYSKGSNWALMEAEGLAFIAMTFPEFKESKAWMEEAISRFSNEITHQVYPDGHQRELAFGYHMGSIRWFLRTYELAEMNGKGHLFPDSYLQMIEKMAEVSMKLAFPDGTAPQFGDAWTGKPGQYYEHLTEWAALFDRPDFLYVATEGQQGEKPAATAFAYPHSGLYSMRSSWDPQAICLVLKCGPNGGGHSQPDNGTFELYAGGRNLTPDSGSFIYSGDPEGRAWFRQSKVHQTLTLNGENIAYAPRLLLWQPGVDHDLLVVENQNYEGLAHRRAVIFFDHSFFILIDEAIGDFSGILDLNFQLAPGPVNLDKGNLKVSTQFSDGYNLFLQTQAQEGLLLEEAEGQVSFVYTKKEPRPAFSFRKELIGGSDGERFITLLIPHREELPAVDAKILGNPTIGSNKISIQVSHQGKEETITYELSE
ncbi:heparinase II/III family protein [Cyclobacterium jeungdonense]|uniref:Heparinase II/III family protein n=1 Tax=Cyclobacterium jeungdonense TaxID=708087 RepID=A0ABT8CBP2_9BACT|nr:heparinase II/III family protein [Cyclobacterium jeungdonense]MDN3689807.1 heparinase II/III family protein [Cyclobacterium jeungdonense]